MAENKWSKKSQNPKKKEKKTNPRTAAASVAVADTVVTVVLCFIMT